MTGRPYTWAESEGEEYLLNENTRAGTRLFNKVLEGAARVADHEVFHECWAAMKRIGVKPDEGTLGRGTSIYTHHVEAALNSPVSRLSSYLS